MIVGHESQRDNSLYFKIMFISLLFLSNLSIWFFYWSISKAIIFGTLWIMILFRFFRSWLNSIWSLTDTITMALIKDKSTYGQHRLHASIAWGLGCMICGYLIDVYSMDIMFYYGTLINIFTILLVALFMPHIPTANQSQQNTQAEYKLLTKPKKTKTKAKSSKNKSFLLLLRTIYKMKRDHEFLYSIGIIQIYFIVMQIIERVIYIQMDQNFKMKRLNIGIITTASVIPEIPIFYYSKQIISKFNGHNKLILFCHFALCLRINLYVFVNDQWSKQMIILSICCIQSLHGITFSLMFSALRHYLHQISMTHSTLELDIGGSVQSILGIIIVLASGAGAYLWLYIYDQHGPQLTYLIGSLTLIPSIVILACNIRKRNKIFNT